MPECRRIPNAHETVSGGTAGMTYHKSQPRRQVIGKASVVIAEIPAIVIARDGQQPSTEPEGRGTTMDDTLLVYTSFGGRIRTGRHIIIRSPDRIESNRIRTCARSSSVRHPPVSKVRLRMN